MPSRVKVALPPLAARTVRSGPASATGGWFAGGGGGGGPAVVKVRSNPIVDARPPDDRSR